MEELKNCPLCGASGVIETTSYGHGMNYFVKCSGCLLRTRAVFAESNINGDQAVKQILELWNSRTEAPKRVKVRRIIHA